LYFVRLVMGQFTCKRLRHHLPFPLVAGFEVIPENWGQGRRAAVNPSHLLLSLQPCHLLVFMEASTAPPHLLQSWIGSQ
jgi:hypothetical protein